MNDLYVNKLDRTDRDMIISMIPDKARVLDLGSSNCSLLADLVARKHVVGFGVDIDGEWRSERKWRRLESHLPELHGKVVADIGCNNGYYMFRMTSCQPD